MRGQYVRRIIAPRPLSPNPRDSPFPYRAGQPIHRKKQAGRWFTDEERRTLAILLEDDIRDGVQIGFPTLLNASTIPPPEHAHFVCLSYQIGA